MSELKVGDKVKADCPNCGRGRRSEVVAIYDHREDADDGSIWSHTSHRILKCPACDQVIHQSDMVFSEDYSMVQTGHDDWEYDFNHAVEQWPLVPLTDKVEPEWIDQLLSKDETLLDLLRSVYRAVANDLNVFAVTGIRTVFDRATETLGIDPAITFGEKLLKLVSQGYIGDTERDHLSTAIDAGSAAAHRGWKPSKDEIGTALEIVEGFIYRAYILKDSASKLRAALPPRQQRQKP